VLRGLRALPEGHGVALGADLTDVAAVLEGLKGVVN